MGKILICHWPLDQQFGDNSEEPELSEAISEYYEAELAPQGIELFKQVGNKIATDKGYYGAFWEEWLEKVDAT